MMLRSEKPEQAMLLAIFVFEMYHASMIFQHDGIGADPPSGGLLLQVRHTHVAIGASLLAEFFVPGDQIVASSASTVAAELPWDLWRPLSTMEQNIAQRRATTARPVLDTLALAPRLDGV